MTMFWQISEGVELLAKQMEEHPHDWAQSDYYFYNVTNRDLRIWTANGVGHIAFNGNDAFTAAEKRYVLNAIKKSIANRLLYPNDAAQTR